MSTNRKTETAGDHNRIVDRTNIQGHINSPGDIRVDGQVKEILLWEVSLWLGPQEQLMVK